MKWRFMLAARLTSRLIASSSSAIYVYKSTMHHTVVLPVSTACDAALDSKISCLHREATKLSASSARTLGCQLC